MAISARREQQKNGTVDKAITIVEGLADIIPELCSNCSNKIRQKLTEGVNLDQQHCNSTTAGVNYYDQER
jgi:hypothetical protein